MVIDVPSGRVTRPGRARRRPRPSVAFRNVPSYVTGRAVDAGPRRGPITVDLSYGGATYA